MLVPSVMVPLHLCSLLAGDGGSGPILEKGSIGSPVQHWVKVVYVLKSITGKRLYRIPSPVLEKVL